MREVTYAIAPRGFATSFTEAELPPQFALAMKNRFINAAGGAEMRQGIQDLHDSDVQGNPKLTGIHEFVAGDGTATLLVSGEGKIWKQDTVGWAQVFSGWTSTAKIRSVQMGGRLIFFNGADRNIYTEDGTNFLNLEALINAGTMANASAGGMDDGNVRSWLDDTSIAINDIVYNADVSAYGLVNAIVTASGTTDFALQHTNISTSGTGIGVAARAQAADDTYRIIDTVELNIIPQPNGFKDNIAVATGS